MEERKKTVGQIYQELHQNDPEYVEQGNFEEEYWKDYLATRDKCVEEGLKKFKGDFFIEVLAKRERLMPDIDRNLFAVRGSCPTPFYDQTVYKYNRKIDEVEFLWILPSKKKCRWYKDHFLEINPEFYALRNHILDYFDGTLLELAMKLNGETSKESDEVESLVKEIYG